MYTFDTNYQLDEPLSHIDEIPLTARWEIDTVLCNYPSPSNPFQPAEKPVPILHDFHLNTAERASFTADEWAWMEGYIDAHYGKIHHDLQESDALEEAFYDAVGVNTY